MESKVRLKSRVGRPALNGPPPRHGGERACPCSGIGPSGKYPRRGRALPPPRARRAGARMITVAAGRLVLRSRRRSSPARGSAPSWGSWRRRQLERRDRPGRRRNRLEETIRLDRPFTLTVRLVTFEALELLRRRHQADPSNERIARHGKAPRGLPCRRRHVTSSGPS
jgi:hypothetical protein